MHGFDHWLADFVKSEPSDHHRPLLVGGLFVDQTVSSSLVSSITSGSSSSIDICRFSKRLGFFRLRQRNGPKGPLFLSVGLSVKESEEGEGCVCESNERERQKGDTDSLEGNAVFGKQHEEIKIKERGSGALNTTKHLWAGAFAAIVSRTCIAPLERLKLEYMVRGEQRGLLELINKIAASEGIKGFWKGNFINILRTAPFKSINFYAYDTYRSQLLKLTGNQETTNFERFVAGAAAGVTASLLCLPMDTIRTVMVAPGGEALGGIIGAFRHMIKTEGFFSLYKGLVPSITSMAPSGAVFYGVYDILKSTYLHSPEGRKRIEHMNQEGQELNALEQLELGTVRTLLYGALAGACAEAATYPFEVVRRHLQMQARAGKLSAVATSVKIFEQGGVPALYAGLIPSVLQVLPSAAISYFVYECMKIILNVESA